MEDISLGEQQSYRGKSCLPEKLRRRLQRGPWELHLRLLVFRFAARAACAAVLLLIAAGLAPAWVESVEFPWSTFPRPLWERELVWLKNIGITHISLPPGGDLSQSPEQLADLIRIIRRLNLEADLEGPVPESLQSLTRAHGGPLTDPPETTPLRIPAPAPDALMRSRHALTSGHPSLLWTDVEDTLGPAGYRPGAVDFSGQERPAAIPVRRSAQLTKYWGSTLPSLHELPGAGTRLPAESVSVHQFTAENGASFVAVANSSATPWTGEVKAFYPAAKRVLVLPAVTVAAHDVAWLPVNVPLMAGPLCRNCGAFATLDHVVYATAELTAMEYENGILAMEFGAPAGGQVILQLSREPSGPLVAGGKPAEFDWDDYALRARLPIPAGKGPGGHVRIGLAIEAPDATAFFDSARVLLIGETNDLTAQFSSDAIAQRSRLRTAPELPVSFDKAKEPLRVVYHIKVPETAIHGDHADLSIEADGSQMSHARPQLLHPATVRFADAIAVGVAPGAVLPLLPAVVPVNQRLGREVAVSIRNNAPEIRVLHLELKAAGLSFSPEKMDVPMGASATREVSFRVFATGASPGLHAGEARLSGPASAVEPVHFLIIPPGGAVAYTAGEVSLIESPRVRASFLPGRWLEYIDKENGQNRIPAGGHPFTSAPIEIRNDALVFGGSRTVRLQDLEPLIPKPKK
jgi:hypothetical protein